MSKTAVFIKVKAKPGKRDEVRKLYEEYIKPHSEQMEGVEFACYCYDMQDEDTVCIFELLSDPSLFTSTMEQDWFKAYQQRMQQLTAAHPEISLATPVFAKGTTL